MIILIRLIAAHLAGDFIFQSNEMSKQKYEGPLPDKLRVLTLHSLIQALLTYIFIGQWSNWILPAVIFVSHFIIDTIKVETKKKGFISLITDQAAHYFVLFLIWWLMYIRHGVIAVNFADSYIASSVWVIITAYIAVLSPASVLIKSFMDYEKWIPSGTSNTGMPNAGKWIGYLERILILTFIFTDNIEGVGFLLAAKSVFRFGDLKDSEDVNLTEYILIGTFLSFTIAILIGFAAKWLLPC